jgi:hypothetical protein
VVAPEPLAPPGASVSALLQATPHSVTQAQMSDLDEVDLKIMEVPGARSERTSRTEVPLRREETL